MRSRRLPPLVRLALLVLGTYLALCSLAGVVLGEAALRPPRRAIDEDALTRARLLAEQQDARMEDIDVRAADDVSLRAWMFTPRAGNGQAVIVLHGVGDMRAGVRGIARILLAAGYIVLTPDARGHGESGGPLITYGLLEREDIHAWVRALRARGVTGCVHGVGVSMGAAQILQSLSIESTSEPQTSLCSAVAESSFASFREVAFDRLGQRFDAGPWLGRTLLRPIVETGIAIAWLRHGVNLWDASPAAVLRDARTPVLLIHGTADHNIPMRHARELEASNPAMATLWIVPDATHTAALGTDPDGYREHVLSFLASHGDQRSLSSAFISR